MGFQLTIAEGKEAGREFVFEQESVTIGRSSDCDVVLYDPGVSRRHARIFAQSFDFFVEDMGSSNGTKLNGQLVKKHKLLDGDAITLGPVVFNFVGTVLPDEPTGRHDLVADQSTRIVALDQVKRQKGKGEALAPQGAGKEALQKIGRSQTQTMQAVSKPRTSNPKLARSTAADPAQAPLASRPKRAADAGMARPALSAAERARIRRESPGLVGNVKLFWLEASERVRRGFYAGAGLLGLGLVAVVYWVVLVDSGNEEKLPPEPGGLSRKPIEHSFGLGEGVTYSRPDMKVFKFEYLAPTRALAIIYYQAKDISQGEVSIIANGREIGLVPPDTMGLDDRMLDVVVPPDVLKRGEPNEIIFDNIRNPPGKETWRVWNLRVDPVPLPEVPLDQLVREARTAFDRANLSEQRITVGAENGYEAWKGFRAAWLLLEGHPEPRPELYDIARLRMRQAQQELDRICARLMLEVETFYNQKNYDGARSTLDHVKMYFPNTNDHLCPRRAELKRYNYRL